MHRPASLASAALTAALALAALPRPSLAAGITSPMTYRLENDGTKPIDHVFLGFVPTGAIIEPDAGKSPLKIVDSSTGFDRSNVDVGIFNLQETPSSPPVQALGLDFQGTGFGFLKSGAPAPSTTGGLGVGQSVTFTLNLDPALANQLQVSLLDPLAVGLSLKSFATTPTTPPTTGPVTTPPPSTNGANPPPTANTPEPLSLLLWAPLAALALVASRRRRPRPSPMSH
jgi:MYXO-CTERM domain-containing protein